MKVSKLAFSLIIILVLIGVLGPQAQGTAILKNYTNGTLATAQNIDPYFSLEANPDIANPTTIPWVSIEALTTSQFDYYSFTVINTGATGFFDIDYGWGSGGNVDTQLGLWDSAGSALVSNDNASTLLGAAGSTHQYDSWLQYSLAVPGTYIIGVAFGGATQVDGGWQGPAPQIGAGYELQVSLQTTKVPEPATLTLISIGLVGLAGGAAGRRLKRKNE